MNLDLWFGPGKRNCGPCNGSGVGYGCPCFKCDGRGWKYKDKGDEERYQNQRRWGIKVDNYLEIEIGEVHDEIHRIAKCLPDLTGEDADWAIQGIREELEKFRDLVERRGKYVTIRGLIDKTCERCAAGEERNEKGNHSISPKVNDSEDAAPIEPPRCLASGLWEELAKVEKENQDVE